MNKNKIKFVFFGSDILSVGVLDGLKNQGLLPSLLVTMPDKPAGRGLELKPTKARVWAKKNNIKTIQPAGFKEIPNELKEDFDVFIVASYGKIIPENILNLPRNGVLNVHPSLLPKYRGPSPIQTAILNGDEKTGVSIILLDREMDHGPVVMQKEIPLLGNENYQILRDLSAELGSEILSTIISDLKSYIGNSNPQDDSQATFTNMLKKEDGLINLNDPVNSYRKFRALSSWPGVYFFLDTKSGKKRIKITNARLENNELIIEKVIPEGKGEMDYSDWQRSTNEGKKQDFFPSESRS